MFGLLSDESTVCVSLPADGLNTSTPSPRPSRHQRDDPNTRQNTEPAVIQAATAVGRRYLSPSMDQGAPSVLYRMRTESLRMSQPKIKLSIKLSTPTESPIPLLQILVRGSRSFLLLGCHSSRPSGVVPSAAADLTWRMHSSMSRDTGLDASQLAEPVAPHRIA
jgi:hypothetical protein